MTGSPWRKWNYPQDRNLGRGAVHINWSVYKLIDGAFTKLGDFSELWRALRFVDVVELAWVVPA